MLSESSCFDLQTRGKGLYEVTSQVEQFVRKCRIQNGTVTIFVRHTSASLVIFENADPSAATDLITFFERLVPEESAGFTHTLEGPDDMTSHIRMALTRTSEVIPIMNGSLALGTWQGVFLFEHRRAPHTRRIVLNVTGC